MNRIAAGLARLLRCDSTNERKASAPRFPTTTGVRQGCIFAPKLFCATMDWIREQMKVDSLTPRVEVVTSVQTDLVYADDTTVLNPSAPDVVAYLSSFGESSSTQSSPGIGRNYRV